MQGENLSNSLSGFSVGITADRRCEEQTVMFQRYGIDVLVGPSVRTLPLDEDHRLRQTTEMIIENPPDYLVANTGVGMRAWFALAASWGVDGTLRDALEKKVKIVARGPKAAGAVVTFGLPISWHAPSENLASVAEKLTETSLEGLRIAVQLHGDEHQDLTETLISAGADVIELPIYRWTPPTDLKPAIKLIEATCNGTLDAVTFTAAPAVRNLVLIAEEIGASADLLEHLNGEVIAACVGPVCAAAAREVGIVNTIVPTTWRLGSLVRLVAKTLELKSQRFAVGETMLMIQGRTVFVDGIEIRLTERERSLLAALAERAGGTVTREALLERIWQDPQADTHNLEVTVARLRAKLGSVADAIETAVRRGYRLNATLIPADLTEA